MPNSGTISVIGVEGTSLVKIGSTTTSVESRLKRLQTGQPFPLHVIAAIPVETDVQRIEKQVHAFLAEERRRGEWFDIALDVEALADLVVRAVQFVQQEDEEHPNPTRQGGYIMIRLGKELRKARIDKSWSQQELAAKTGISQKHLSALECDQMMPKWPTIVTLARVLDLDLNTLARDWVPVPPEVPALTLRRATGWFPWIPQDARDIDASPYTYTQVEIARVECERPQCVDPGTLHPTTNVVGLWWRPVPQGGPRDA